MQNYKKTYCKAFGYCMTNDQFIPSELSGCKAVDIHHIVDRSNRIENLMALTREEHVMYGEVKRLTFYLLDRHIKFMESKGVDYDADWIELKLKHYEQFMD